MISLAVYLATVFLTDISLTGFWTDVIFSSSLSVLILILAFGCKATKLRRTLALKTASIFCSLLVMGFLLLKLIDPFVRDTFKLRSFYYQSVDGRLFNAYFKPVGAYSGGYGNFWITESPNYFPIIERQVYWQRVVHHDFNDDTFDGHPIDNYEVVRSYIRKEVIDK
ncbi:hypothetical protein J2T02_001678 [Chitinophaga terrae (ex Kim and Jung 2007)]|uniref:hypothetical protein n=1 Tax=Chitinophaga terrae (ex Kim and Jung 2007) TaxID=408074 RepID=UPI00278B41DE|nr:hypothetical protein [Chitinophaga terrae (ex Kim and Jung 2007)]MDQ0106567.1 hypothetical protein [Chitinophaga terrae (ex Kim and Jung 2007)]